MLDAGGWKLESGSNFSLQSPISNLDHPPRLCPLVFSETRQPSHEFPHCLIQEFSRQAARRSPDRARARAHRRRHSQRRKNIRAAERVARRRTGDPRRASPRHPRNRESALLRPATVMYTLGRGSVSYSRNIASTCFRRFVRRTDAHHYVNAELFLPHPRFSGSALYRRAIPSG